MRISEKKNAFDYELVSAIKSSLYKQNSTELSDGSASYLVYDHQKMLKPNKVTLLHDYIMVFMTWYFGDSFENMGDEEIINYVCGLFTNTEEQIPVMTYSSLEEGSISYQKFLESKYTCLAHGVFNILYNDRVFLRDFGIKISQYVKSLHKSDYPDLLSGNGVIKRYSRLQQTVWLSNAIRHRDQEHCQICGCDLSATRSKTTGSMQVDHIVPLKLGGTNDPTNLQLLCKNCNQDKHAKDSVTNSYYTDFWDIMEHTNMNISKER